MSFGDGYGQVVLDGKTILEDTSSTSPALASLPGHVLLAWTGSDTRINTLWSRDGVRFQGKQTLVHCSSKTHVTRTRNSNTGFSEERTWVEPLAPALAAVGGALHMAWTGIDTRLHVWAAERGHAVLSETSGHAPAIGAWRQDVALAWTGTNRRLNVLFTQGGMLGPTQRLEQTSSHGPALCGLGDEVALAWTGTDRHLNVLTSRGGGFGPPLRLKETSAAAPTLCALGSELVLGWKGTDRRVNVLVLGPGYIGVHVLLPATTRRAPTVCAHDGGGVLVAWTGTDGRLNVSRIRLGSVAGSN